MEKLDLLIFKTYEIEKMKMEKSKLLKEDANFNILYKIIPNKINFDKANVIQGVLLEGTKEFPYTIEVILKGNFIIKSDIEIEKKKELLLSNAAAILFPYLRTSISFMSSQTEYEKIILPTLNFTSIVSKMDKKSIFLNEKDFQDFDEN